MHRHLSNDSKRPAINLHIVHLIVSLTLVFWWTSFLPGGHHCYLVDISTKSIPKVQSKQVPPRDSNQVCFTRNFSVLITRPLEPDNLPPHSNGQSRSFFQLTFARVCAIANSCNGDIPIDLQMAPSSFHRSDASNGVSQTPIGPAVPPLGIEL